MNGRMYAQSTQSSASGSIPAQMPQLASPIDGLLNELSDVVREARAEAQELTNKLTPVRLPVPRGADGDSAQEQPCISPVELSLMESIAVLRGMIDGIRATKAELRVY